VSSAPYLQSNRLADVVAAIQFMALNERSSLDCASWAEGIVGDPSRADCWRKIFDEHPEFFRKSPNYADHYALIWRRAMPRRYSRLKSRMLTQAEYEELPNDQKANVSRPPVPEEQINTLVDIAVTLHEKQLELHRDWRWWVPVIFGFIGSIVGALIGSSIS
jgi:hypothetical protein